MNYYRIVLSADKYESGKTILIEAKTKGEASLKLWGMTGRIDGIFTEISSDEFHHCIEMIKDQNDIEPNMSCMRG